MNQNLKSFYDYPQPVLDDGWVKLIDIMGDDKAIEDSARISYGGKKGNHLRTELDRERLIRYMMRHHHGTPFEMCEIKLAIRVPLYVWQQWLRHRTASINQRSTRYSESFSTCHRYTSSEWRGRSDSNKQGSGEFLPETVGRDLSKEQDEIQTLAQEVYNRRLLRGVSKEQARVDLPHSTYTEAFWKIDLRNLLHFLELRLDEHAQWEIREYAHAIAEIVKMWVPMTWRAFQDYRLNSLTLSGPEIELLADLLANPLISDGYFYDREEILRRVGQGLVFSSEGKEFQRKLERLRLL